MNINQKYLIKMGIVAADVEGRGSDVYDCYATFRAKNRNSGYTFVFRIIDSMTGSMPDWGDGWYATPDEAMRTYEEYGCRSADKGALLRVCGVALSDCHSIQPVIVVGGFISGNRSKVYDDFFAFAQENDDGEYTIAYRVIDAKTGLVPVNCHLSSTPEQALADYEYSFCPVKPPPAAELQLTVPVKVQLYDDRPEEPYICNTFRQYANIMQWPDPLHVEISSQTQDLLTFLVNNEKIDIFEGLRTHDDGYFFDDLGHEYIRFSDPEVTLQRLERKYPGITAWAQAHAAEYLREETES